MPKVNKQIGFMYIDLSKSQQMNCYGRENEAFKGYRRVGEN